MCLRLIALIACTPWVARSGLLIFLISNGAGSIHLHVLNARRSFFCDASWLRIGSSRTFVIHFFKDSVKWCTLRGWSFWSLLCLGLSGQEWNCIGYGLGILWGLSLTVWIGVGLKQVLGCFNIIGTSWVLSILWYGMAAPWVLSLVTTCSWPSWLPLLGWWCNLGTFLLFLSKTGVGLVSSALWNVSDRELLRIPFLHRVCLVEANRVPRLSADV